MKTDVIIIKESLWDKFWVDMKELEMENLKLRKEKKEIREKILEINNYIID